MRHTPRRATALLAALGVLAAPLAHARTRCGSEAEQAAFEMAALKTELMVVATACRQDEPYNAFVNRYRSELTAADRGIGAHFARTKGRGAGQKAHDAYVTNLANARATEAQKLGSDHCPRNAGLFTEVMALPSGAELAPYAAAKDLVPTTLGACEAPPSTPARATRQASARRR